MNKLQELYERMWSVDAYRKESPGKTVLPNFLSIATPQLNDRILDIGCGTGKASVEMHQRGFTDIILMDFAKNCLDDSTKNLLAQYPTSVRFVQHDITTPFPITATFGYCTDVMEHLDPSQVRNSLMQMKSAVEFLYLRISTRPDVMGKLIGERLHLTVYPIEWWLDVLNELQFEILYSDEHKEEAATFFVKTN
jgi:SAM-dependent methyltransferase